ncbi:MAG: glycosyltransferase, partial [Actinomycetes bacterium]
IVRDAIAAGVPLGVYGVGWSEFIDAEYVRGEFLPNPDVPAAYASAGIVLNDHWPQMAAEGFLSNRLFDAVASGARVISDEAAGLQEVFGDAVVTYSSAEQLREILQAPLDSAFASRERRLANAERIARDHGFDARASELIAAALEMRGAR